MKSGSICCTLASLAVLCQAAPLSLPRKADSNLYRLPIRRSAIPKQLQQRQLPVSISNVQYQYLIDASIGTPAQAVTLIVDTGSSDLWLPTPQACPGACSGSTYDPTQSSTVDYVDDLGNFYVSYVDNSYASGYYVTDTVALASASLTNVIIGVANETTVENHGILGIGMDGNEADSIQHSGFIDDLYNQGVISSHSYSIYLDNLQASTGEVIFGGTDSSKYSGDLVSLPDSSSVELQVPWTYLSLTDESGNSNTLTSDGYSQIAYLDTGSSYTELPSDMYNAVVTATGADASNGYTVSCSLSGGSLTFGFGGDSSAPAVSVTVPFSELAVPDSSGNCYLGLSSGSDNGAVIFGDTFLRSAYVYFDYDDSTISLAQAA